MLRDIGATGEALLSLGFMRRFDPGYVQLREAIDDGTIGAPVLVHNISRGVSGAPNATSEFSITGSAIHEFDVVPWLLRSPVVEVSWVAPRRSSQVHEGLQDPQLIHLRTADGVLSTCETFLNARYGYDIRCEVVGETGAISLTEPARVRLDAGQRHGIGYAADWRPRFADAYRIELQAWVDSVLAGEPTPLATGRDGVAASAVAEAVITSMHEGGRVTKVELAVSFPAPSRPPACPTRWPHPRCAGACWAPAGSRRSSPVPCAATPARRWSPSGRGRWRRRRSSPDRVGIGRAHGSYADLVADPEVDVVYVATPHNFHHRHALLALDAGKHVLVEKPLALNAAEAARGRGAGRRAGRVLRRGDVDVLPAELRRDPSTARRRRARRRAHGAGRPRRVVPRHAPHPAPRPGRGALLDLGTYPLALASWVLGEPELVGHHHVAARRQRRLAAHRCRVQRALRRGALDRHVVERRRAAGRGGQHRAGQRAGTGAGVDDHVGPGTAQLLPPPVERPGQDGAEQRADLRAGQEVAAGRPARPRPAP